MGPLTAEGQYVTTFPSFGEHAERRELQAGVLLCVEGDSDTDVFQIETGSFDVMRLTNDGLMAVATVGVGELVGEVVSALGGQRSATVKARETSTVASLTQSEFAEWLSSNEKAAAEVRAEARLRSNRSRAASVLANLFGLENQSVVDAIVDEIRWLTLGPGDQLFAQGDEADAAYLVLAGRMRVTATDPEGRSILYPEIVRGEIVGEMGILEDAPRSAGVEAIRETTLAMISRQAFERTTSAHPGLMIKVFRTVMDRVLHRHEPDSRARVVGVVSTLPANAIPATVVLEPFVDAVEEFGSTLHLSSANLGTLVRDVDGLGGAERIAEFLHEADVANDYVVLEGDTELTDWSVSVARQSDRFVVFTSAYPDTAEIERIRARLDLLSESQRAGAWIARVFPSGTDRPRRTPGLLASLSVGEVHNLRSGDSAHMARLGRLATGNGRGVVLGGGGAKGFAHIGALKALREAGVEYDRIGGASMGALVGAIAAKDVDCDQILDVSKSEFQKDLLDYTVPLVAILKAGKIAQRIEKEFGSWDIDDLWIPFFCVTVNLTKSELVVHRHGNLGRAVRASSAIPVALPPVPIDGDLHVDGGILDNIPVATMRSDNSIGTVIAVDVSTSGGPAAMSDYGPSVSGFAELKRRVRRKPSTYPDIGTTLMSSMLIGSSQAKRDSVAGGEVDLYIDLDLTGVGFLRFENHDAVADRGYVGAKQAIEDWQGQNPAVAERF